MDDYCLVLELGVERPPALTDARSQSLRRMNLLSQLLSEAPERK